MKIKWFMTTIDGHLKMKGKITNTEKINGFICERVNLSPSNLKTKNQIDPAIIAPIRLNALKNSSSMLATIDCL